LPRVLDPARTAAEAERRAAAGAHACARRPARPGDPHDPAAAWPARPGGRV